MPVLLFLPPGWDHLNPLLEYQYTAMSRPTFSRRLLLPEEERISPTSFLLCSPSSLGQKPGHPSPPFQDRWQLLVLQLWVARSGWSAVMMENPPDPRWWLNVHMIWKMIRRATSVDQVLLPGPWVSSNRLAQSWRSRCWHNYRNWKTASRRPYHWNWGTALPGRWGKLQ